VWGTLTATLAYGLELTEAEQDDYVREQHRAAALLHVPGPLPSTKRELDAEITAKGGRDAALTLPAADIALALRNPDGANAMQRWVTRNVQYGLLSLMPAWALQLYGIDGFDDRRVRAGRRWMRLMMRLSTRNRTMHQLIDDAMAEATVH